MEKAGVPAPGIAESGESDGFDQLESEGTGGGSVDGGGAALSRQRRAPRAHAWLPTSAGSGRTMSGWTLAAIPTALSCLMLVVRVEYFIATGSTSV